MTRKPARMTLLMRCAIAVLICALVCGVSISSEAQGNGATPEYGIAVKRPVLQAACRYCPWGALGDIVKRVMAPYGYDVAICYSCSGDNSVRSVSKKLVSAEISDRQFAEGTVFRPDAPIDFGITQMERVRWAYEGADSYNTDGPFKNLRLIAKIESPSYLMIAAVQSSGITDLKQIRENKMPVRIMLGVGGGPLNTVLDYYGITKKDVTAWGGKFIEGNALLKNPDFDLIMGISVLSNYPEGNMWYEMTQKKDLVFFPIAEDLRQELVREDGAELVELPFRYMRGVGDKPLPTVGMSGLAVYGRDDLPDQFVYDVARALDEKHGLIKWANQPFSYDPATVWNGADVPLHPAAERYYRERGYMK
jgi:TRAP transporter TAXI family solute receptor